MASKVVFYFQVHQPFRTRPYDFFSIGKDHQYFENSDHTLNKDIISRVSKNAYIPANTTFLNLIKKYPQIKLTLSLSGVLLEQLEENEPESLTSFQNLVETGNVELLSETYYHSLAFIYSLEEFNLQVEKHAEAMQRLFTYKPTAFRNTELIYNDDLALHVNKLGYKTILAEGTPTLISNISPNYVYSPKSCSESKILFRNYHLADELAFRFLDNNKQLKPKDYVDHILKNEGDLVNIFLDYETFGEHYHADTGIFNFLEEVFELLIQEKIEVLSVTEASKKLTSKDSVLISDFTSWSDNERDLSAWLENPLQSAAAETLYKMRDQVYKTEDEKIISDWQKLTTSDHTYYMSTKSENDKEVHEYFSHYTSPYEAYSNYMNILHDIRERVYT